MDRVNQFQIMSDLHLETPRFMPMYSTFNIAPHCNVLALLGDIGSVHDVRLFDFLELQLQKFRFVLYVLGNHEPYDGSLETAISTMQDFEAANMTKRQQDRGLDGFSTIGQFIFMNRRRIDLTERLTVLGCTLFSSIKEEQKSSASLFISDFTSIEAWDVDNHNAAHVADLAWLNTEVQSIARGEPTRSIIILTHYSPTTDAQANDPEHIEDSRGVNSAFVTDLSVDPCWTNSAVKLWAFGHTHYNCNYIDEMTRKRVIANQRGYGREDIFNFDADMISTCSEEVLRGGEG